MAPGMVGTRALFWAAGAIGMGPDFGVRAVLVQSLMEHRVPERQVVRPLQGLECIQACPRVQVWNSRVRSSELHVSACMSWL